jgi:Helix-turn-helix domain/RodZ C-terminal domain
VFEIGSSLRDARLRKGLELADLETETKIRAKYLRALEEEHFDQLPGDTYVKGFLRIYAEKLGLDGQLYVDEYNSRFSLTEEPVLAMRTRGRARHARFEANAVIVALAGIVAVTVLVIAAWQLGGSDGDGAEQAATGTVVTGTTGDTIAEEPVGEAPSVQLVLTARKASAAIEVRRDSATGELLWEGTLSKGDDQSVEGDRLWVRIGKGQNIALTLNGEPVERLGRGEQVLLVTETGVQPASP